MKKILAELKAVALARPLDCLDWNDGKLELKELEKIPARSRAGIASIERNTTGVKVKFHDKLKACELLLRYGEGGSTNEQNNLLEAILSATRGGVDPTGIEEMESDFENGISIAAGS